VLVDHFNPPDTWTATETILITTKNGDVINGTVAGGSVCEPAGGGSDNTALTSFKITGGTGKFTDASGSALARIEYASGGPVFINEIFLHLD